MLLELSAYNGTVLLNVLRLQKQMKKRLEETQTLRAGCSKAEPKFLANRRLGARDGQNLISWKWSLPLPTNRVW